MKIFVPFSTLKYDMSMRIKGEGVKNLTSFPLLPFLICSNAISKKYSGFALSGVMLFFNFFIQFSPRPLPLEWRERINLTEQGAGQSHVVGVARGQVGLGREL